LQAAIGKNPTSLQKSQFLALIMSSSSDKTEIDTNGLDSPSQKKDWRFWSIIACLSITAVLASID
jgi:hypothetical protein